MIATILLAPDLLAQDTVSSSSIMESFTGVEQGCTIYTSFPLILSFILIDISPSENLESDASATGTLIKSLISLVKSGCELPNKIMTVKSTKIIISYH